LDVELDADLLADEHAAGVEGHVPGETPVLPIDVGGGAEGDALVADGETLAPSKSTSSVTGRVTSRTVRSPVTAQVPEVPGSTLVERKVMVGYVSASKKSALRRWPSRSGLPVSRLATSSSTSTWDRSGWSSMVMVPDTSGKRPRTLVIMRWRPMNSTEVWAGSMA
jgi:hypothetical protein